MNFENLYNEIIESIKSRKLSLWVGAGISHRNPSFLPLADDLKFYIIYQICRELRLYRFYNNRLQKTKDLGQKIKNYPFEAFIELINYHHIIEDAFVEIFRKSIPNKNHLFIAKLIKMGLIKEVLTPNFDLSIEKALKKSGFSEKKDFKVFYSEEQFSKLKFDLDLPTIYKIHGSAHDVKSIRTTLNLVSSTRLSKARRKILENFLIKEGDVLILGYSARDDFDINPFLSIISASKAKQKKRIFYINHETCDPTIDNELPSAFKNFKGYTITCDTSELIDNLWNIFTNNEQYNITTRKISMWKKDIDNWIKTSSKPLKYHLLAVILHKIEEFESALRFYKKSLKNYKKFKDKIGTAIILHQIAIIEQTKGNYNKAYSLFNQAFNTLTKYGSKEQLASTMINLGSLELRRGNMNEALILYNKARGIFEKLGDERKIATIFLGLADIEVIKDFDKAEELYLKSFELMREIGHQEGMAVVLNRHAEAAEANNDYFTAGNLCFWSKKIFTKLGIQSGIARNLLLLGNLAWRKMFFDVAEKHFVEAYNIFKQIGMKQHLVLIEDNLKEIKKLKKKYSRSIKYWFFWKSGIFSDFPYF